MNKADKRQRSIRNKLLAAVAMLLVASIMTVSTTYAWFTLSTAPEVQGITTTVGANGNLEIALSPLSGDVNELKTTVNDGNIPSWVDKNLTWGNLLNLSDASYELDKILMMPSQMQASNNVFTLTNGSPLAFPVYGTDGRITKLDSGTLIGGKLNISSDGSKVELSPDFKAYTTSPYYGVRAVGTASGMTENAKAMLAGKAALRGGIAEAARVVSVSLNANGNALANMMVNHAMAAEGETENYREYVVAVTALVTALNSSVDAIDSAMQGMLLAAAASELTGEELTDAQTAILAGTFDPTTLENWTEAMGKAYDDVKAQRDKIVNNYATPANAALEQIPDDNSAVGWDAIYNVVKYLMNTDGVLINGKDYAYVSGNYGSMINDLIKGVNMTLGEGSGVYYEIHKIASKVSGATLVSIDAGKVITGMGVVELNATIETTYSGTTLLGTANNTVMALEAAEESTDGENAGTKLDVFYGYILDFVFRTNAADSYLQLQTEAANRVYQDGGSESTMGAGSTISFTVPENVEPNIVKGLTEGIRLAFFNPADGEIYAMAKATEVAIEETTTTGENGASVTTKTVVGTLKLCEYTNNGAVTVSDAKTDANDSTHTNRDESVTICALDQNVAKRVSVLVSLDGESVTNADIMAEGQVTGVLNLQFASSANLVPMENAGLRGGNDNNAAGGGDASGT